MMGGGWTGQKHFRASDTGGKMSAVETSDYVSSEHFLGTSLALDSVGAQLAELCPACAGGTIGESPGEGAAAAPFVAVLVGSSEVRNRHRTQTMCPSLSLSFSLSRRLRGNARATEKHRKAP